MDRPASEGIGILLWIVTPLGAFLLPQLMKNTFEEAAWHGYLAPKVYSFPLNDLIGHLIVGLILGAWHIPYYRLE